MIRLARAIPLALALAACSRSPDAGVPQGQPISQARAGAVSARLEAAPTAPTLADVLRVTLTVERPAGAALDWPDPGVAFPGWIVRAVADHPPLAHGDAVTESRRYDLAPFLPGEYALGPIDLAVDGVPLTLPRAGIVVASPTPAGVEPVLADLRDAPPEAPAEGLPASVWWIAGACALAAPLTALALRRQSSAEPDPRSATARAEARLRLLAHAPPTPETLDEIDRALRDALASLEGRPATLTLRELSTTAALRTLADRLDAARFARAEPDPRLISDAADALAARRHTPGGHGA